MKLNILLLFDDLILAVPSKTLRKDIALLNYLIMSYVCAIYPWQVFQRRVDNTTDFFRDWKSYKEGFGDPIRNFWLGMSKQLTLHFNCRDLWVMNVF